MICFDDCNVNREIIVSRIDKKVKLSKIANSNQEKDITNPVNFSGYGRIRHFNRKGDNWNDNPLPIDPACRFFKIPGLDKIEAEVFQIALCNFNCWYCFVDEKLLRADDEFSSWVSIDEMINFISGQHIKLIDLSGGQPDLAPEWSLWVLRGLRSTNLDKDVFVWQDDNLSCNSLRKYLSESEIEELVSFKNYARVGCFKGFDEITFKFNTGMSEHLFDNQFTIMNELIKFGFDVYAYVTFTTPTIDNIDYKIKSFVEKLQKINPLLPLRTVPLKIRNFTPTSLRLKKENIVSFNLQVQVLEKWNEVLQDNYGKTEIERNITDIPIR